MSTTGCSDTISCSRPVTADDGCFMLVRQQRLHRLVLLGSVIPELLPLATLEESVTVLPCHLATFLVNALGPSPEQIDATVAFHGKAAGIDARFLLDVLCDLSVLESLRLNRALCTHLVKRLGSSQHVSDIGTNDETREAPVSRPFNQRLFVSISDIERRSYTLSTSVEALDRILLGGLPAGFVVEIAGAAHAGKSLLAQRIVASLATRSAALSVLSSIGEAPPPSALYIDIDQTTPFVALNLVTAISSYTTPKSPSERPAASDSQRAFDFVSILTGDELIRGCDADTVLPAFVFQLQTALTDARAAGVSYALIVIDSITTLVRRAFSGGRQETYMQHDAVAAFLQALKATAEVFDCVIIFTSCAHLVAATRNGAHEGGEGAQSPLDMLHKGITTAGQKDPSLEGIDAVIDARGTAPEEFTLVGGLGNTFFHAVSTRIFIEHLPLQQGQTVPGRIAHVVKSPLGPPAYAIIP